jgi:hypothetical protein
VFPTHLDWAQLWHGTIIVSAELEQMSGRIEVDQGETRWRFTPDAPWAPAHGSYWPASTMPAPRPHGSFWGHKLPPVWGVIHVWDV